MDVILIQDVDNLGGANELVKVKKDKNCKNLVILGHLAGDSIGMNQICKELEKREIEVVKRGVIDDN